jgi:GT2 family glycosyltransferase
MVDPVLPVYLIHWNAPDWCVSSARSILASEGVEVKLIVVNNGGLPDFAREELERRGVQVMSTGKNLGYAGGANVALRDWLGKTDSEFAVVGAHDLHVEPRALSQLLKAAKRDRRYGILGPVLLRPFESSGGVWNGRTAWQVPPPASSESGVWDRDWISGTCMFFRKECLAQLGGFDEGLSSYCEDVDICLRAIALGWRVGVVAGARAWGLGSRSSDAGALIEANTVRVALRHGGWRVGMRALLTLVSWWVRALVGTLLLWRPRFRRQESFAFLKRHSKALAGLCAAAVWWQHPTTELLPGANGPPRVSVIIPTRNRRVLVQEAVESVRRQTYPNWELIVVDDCSEDDTWAWLSSLGDPRIRAIRLERHSERSAARNRGLEEARGEWVLFLDDDDLLTLRALVRLMGAAVRKPGAVGVAGAAIQFDSRGHRRRVPWPRRRWEGSIWPAVLWGWCILQGQAAIRRDALLSVGGWEEGLAVAEDQELWLRLGLQGSAVLVPDAVLMNRVHVTWRGADTAQVESRIRERFVREHSGPDASLARRVLASREAFGRAGEAYRENRFGTALRWWWRSVSKAPEVVFLALVRPSVLGLGTRIIVGGLAGRRATNALRHLAARLREHLHKAPTARVEVWGSALGGTASSHARTKGGLPWS